MYDFTDILGWWVAIFLTLAIFSFLYKDNPIYKIAEHLFIGVSIGVVIVQQYFDTLRPLLINQLSGGDLLVALPALLLAVLLFAKLASPRIAWLGRYPLAFLIAVYAGLEVGALADSDLGVQMKETANAMSYEAWHKADLNEDPAKNLGKAGFPPSVIRQVMQGRKQGKRFNSVEDVLALPGLTRQEKILVEGQRSVLFGMDGLDRRVGSTKGEVYWFGFVSQLLLILGTLCALLYFFFSVPHKGVIGGLSRVGVIFLMIAFGAAFGFTVQGRVALAFGRVKDLTGQSLPSDAVRAQVQPELVTLICLAFIIVFLVLWEMLRRNKGSDDDGTASE